MALVLDGSASMRGHSKNLIRVADEQIKYLALRSEELSQETRVSVYLFNSRVECLIFDMDVMRLPSIEDLYSTSGMTALIDATLKSQDDLATTSQIYGDHAFLTFVLTDGVENASVNPWTNLGKTLSAAEENWSIGFLVPNRDGVAYMKRIGATDGNIAIWDAENAHGVAEAASKIKHATDNFMTARATGVRGTRNVFSTGIDAVNKQTVHQSLDPISGYNVYDVPRRTSIKAEMAVHGHAYAKGLGYYQLTKTETIQENKKIVVFEKKTNKAYSGAHARDLIGLPHGERVRVRPDRNPKYDIFVQSTAPNRVLLPGTKLLVWNG